jgi:hypothetical protein
MGEVMYLGRLWNVGIVETTWHNVPAPCTSNTLFHKDSYLDRFFIGKLSPYLHIAFQFPHVTTTV